MLHALLALSAINIGGLPLDFMTQGCRPLFEDTQIIMASPGPQLPTETVHCILSFLVAYYIDDLITGPLSLPVNSKDTETPGEVSVYLFLGLIACSADRRVQDPALVSPNPVVALLAVSNQLRQVAMKILSDILMIPLHQGDACDELWRYVHAMIGRHKG